MIVRLELELLLREHLLILEGMCADLLIFAIDVYFIILLFIIKDVSLNFLMLDHPIIFTVVKYYSFFLS